MDTTHPNGIAPVNAGTYQLGAKGGRMARAWQYIWDQLNTTNYKGGLELATEAAEKFDLKKVSVSEMLCRMRAAGVIEQETIEAPTMYLRTQAVTLYAAGADFDAEIELTASQCDKGLAPVLEAMRQAIQVKFGDASTFDRDAFIQEFSEVQDVAPKDVKLLINTLSRAGVLRKVEGKEDRTYTANRARVHYRIAKQEQTSA